MFRVLSTGTRLSNNDRHHRPSTIDQAPQLLIKWIYMLNDKSSVIFWLSLYKLFEGIAFKTVNIVYIPPLDLTPGVYPTPTLFIASNLDPRSTEERSFGFHLGSHINPKKKCSRSRTIMTKLRPKGSEEDLDIYHFYSQPITPLATRPSFIIIITKSLRLPFFWWKISVLAFSIIILSWDFPYIRWCYS